MNKEDTKEYLRGLSDNDLYYFLKSVFEGRNGDWAECKDSFGWPTNSAIIASIKKLLGD